MATQEQQQKLQELSDQYRDLETGMTKLYMSLLTHTDTRVELQETVAARQKLESQQQENKSVQKVCD